jgi:hypothetical protein
VQILFNHNSIYYTLRLASHLLIKEAEAEPMSVILTPQIGRKINYILMNGVTRHNGRVLGRIHCSSGKSL